MQEPSNLLLVAGQGIVLVIVAIVGVAAALFILGLARAAIRGAAREYMRARMKGREGHIDIPQVAEVLDELVRLGDRPTRILAFVHGGMVRSFEWDRHDNTYRESDDQVLHVKQSL